MSEAKGDGVTLKDILQSAADQITAWQRAGLVSQHLAQGVISNLNLALTLSRAMPDAVRLVCEDLEKNCDGGDSSGEMGPWNAFMWDCAKRLRECFDG
jgi:hypothetical protein